MPAATEMTYFLVATPYAFPDEFAVIEADPPVNVHWLFPLHDVEAELVRAKGIDAFVRAHDAVRPEVFDWRRPPVI